MTQPLELNMWCQIFLKPSCGTNCFFNQILGASVSHLKIVRHCHLSMTTTCLLALIEAMDLGKESRLKLPQFTVLLVNSAVLLRPLHGLHHRQKRRAIHLEAFSLWHEGKIV